LAPEAFAFEGLAAKVREILFLDSKRVARSVRPVRDEDQRPPYSLMQEMSWVRANRPRMRVARHALIGANTERATGCAVKERLHSRSR
jgi:hypothetical protein